MTHTRSFGRRTLDHDDRKDEIGHYVRMEAVPVKKGWGWGKITLAVLGGFLLVGAIQNAVDKGNAVETKDATVAAAKPAPCVATLTEFTSLQTGMSRRQAESIIGCPGTEQSRASYGGQETVMLSWDGNQFISNMNATFENDQLIAQTQIGLK